MIKIHAIQLIGGEMIELLIGFALFVKVIDRYFFEKPSTLRWILATVSMFAIALVVDKWFRG